MIEESAAMDWPLHWVAFGAIGMTLGSLITAVAVVEVLQNG